MSAGAATLPKPGIEAGETVERDNQVVLEQIEEDWRGMRLSLVQYRRLQESAVRAVNQGLLVSFVVDCEPVANPVRLNGEVLPSVRTDPGVMHVLPPATLFESRSPPSKRAATYLNMVFTLEVLNEFAADGHPATLDPSFRMEHPFLKTLCEQIVAQARRGGTSAMYREAASRFLLASLLDAVNDRSRRVASGGLSPRQLHQVCDYAVEHLEREISLVELASIAGLSPFHFARAFKRSTGLPPHAWLTRRRIERAQEMILAHPALPLIEVALCVGYASQTAFGAAFRRVVGATPAEWRRDRMG
jgi:AraC family transcriptional regulator